MMPRDHAIELFDEFHDILNNVVPDASIRGRRTKSEAARQCALMFVDQMQAHCGHELTEYWRQVENEINTLL
jgi:hypothetical protein